MRQGRAKRMGNFDTKIERKHRARTGQGMVVPAICIGILVARLGMRMVRFDAAVRCVMMMLINRDRRGKMRHIVQPTRHARPSHGNRRGGDAEAKEEKANEPSHRLCIALDAMRGRCALIAASDLSDRAAAQSANCDLSVSLSVSAIVEHRKIPVSRLSAH